MDSSSSEHEPGGHTRSVHRVLGSRQVWVALLAICGLTALGLVHKIDTSMAIAMVAGAVAASNGYEKRGNDSKVG